MPAFALLALLPLLLTLAFAPPAVVHRGQAAQPTRPALLATAELPALPSLALDPAPAEHDPADVDSAPASAAPASPVQHFASLLAEVPVVNRLPFVAPAAPAAPSAPAVSAPYTPLLTLLRPPHLVLRDGWPARVTAADLVDRAESLMHVPYVWGGDSPSGLDCSAFVSRVWGVGRHTTDTLGQVAFKIDKDELLPGDILNMTTSQDPEGYGHVRLFAGWANAQHSRMWVYEETPPRSLHHVIAYDSRYTPMRRINYEPGDLRGAHLTDLLFGTPAPAPAADADDGDGRDDDSGGATTAATLPGPEPSVALTTDAAGWLAHPLGRHSRVSPPDGDAEWRSLDLSLAAWGVAISAVPAPPRPQPRPSTWTWSPTPQPKPAATAGERPWPPIIWLPQPSATPPAEQPPSEPRRPRPSSPAGDDGDGTVAPVRGASPVASPADDTAVPVRSATPVARPIRGTWPVVAPPDGSTEDTASPARSTSLGPRPIRGTWPVVAPPDDSTLDTASPTRSTSLAPRPVRGTVLGGAAPDPTAAARRSTWRPPVEPEAERSDAAWPPLAAPQPPPSPVSSASAAPAPLPERAASRPAAAQRPAAGQPRPDPAPLARSTASSKRGRH